MNIFILDKNTAKSARYHCNTHIIKMPLEIAQILCTVLSKHNVKSPYKATHQNHPCTIWAGLNSANFKYARKLGLELCKEYTHRYAKILAVQEILESIEIPESLCKGKLTDFAKAMPTQYLDKDAVIAYRNYYLGEKLCQDGWRWKYKARVEPDWLKRI